MKLGIVYGLLAVPVVYTTIKTFMIGGRVAKRFRHWNARRKAKKRGKWA